LADVTEAFDDITEQQRDEAARWVVRLDGGPLDAGDHAAFRAWLAADRRHGEALRQSQAMWARLDAPARRLAALPPGRARHGWRRAGGIAAMAASLVVLWLGYPALRDGVQNLGADAVADFGRIERARLPDGSGVELAAGSAAAWSFSDGKRQVDLLRGEAFFTVTRNEDVPFVVRAGDARVQVLGTRFDVRLDGDVVHVNVEEGRVAVRGNDRGEGVELTAGRGVTVANGIAGAVTAADLTQALAWRNGQIVFYRAPLADVVARLEREQGRRIVIARAALGGLPVSGAFPASDLEGALTAIADTLGVRIVHSPWLTLIY
jgi:transmembrane sensor